MDFGSQFKQMRTNANMSQDEVADKLFVTRQAISNWENNKNLPDLQMLMSISNLFHVSLDELILGENRMNNMTEKLIEDTNETKASKRNLMSTIIGVGSLLFGCILIFIKACSVEYIDEAGILHENFFLLPIGFLFIFAGLFVLIVSGIKRIINYLKGK